MRRVCIFLAAAVLASLLDSCGGSGTMPYDNPVISDSSPDPTILDNRERDGWFYLASTSTHVLPGAKADPWVKDTSEMILPIWRSHDLTRWELCGDGFKGGTPPVWRPGANLWAPDLNFVNGKYVVYYALGVWHDVRQSGSGVAVADSPAGPYTDVGMLVDYHSTGVSNSIDPNYFDDGRHKYLFWGSVNRESGIWAVELSHDGLSLKADAVKTQVGCKYIEGTYVHKHDGWYYLFASRGSCCVGADSKYHLTVARSDNVLGPYYGKEGTPLLDPDFDETILHGRADSVFVGTGHNAEIFTDDKGQDWMIFHSYWKGNGFRWRVALLEPVYWDDEGWPYFIGDEPSVHHDFSPTLRERNAPFRSPDRPETAFRE